MVRLKELQVFCRFVFNVVFQFQNGTIKRLRKPIAHYYLRCFNSKMVRLKGDANQQTTAITVKFQFQNGTIKSI